eukprot:355285-Chlamydomonas_euryale.AAC.5
MPIHFSITSTLPTLCLVSGRRRVGDYQDAVALLSKGADDVGADTEIGGDAQIWLALAYQVWCSLAEPWGLVGNRNEPSAASHAPICLRPCTCIKTGVCKQGTGPACWQQLVSASGSHLRLSAPTMQAVGREEDALQLYSILDDHPIKKVWLPHNAAEHVWLPMPKAPPCWSSRCSLHVSAPA